ncbi:MAG: hypothetical protein QM770_04660 [Tepidisphaeraceae bacterium]
MAENNPRLRSTKAEALQAVDTFAAQMTNSPWKLKRDAVADRLRDIVNDPTLVQQGNINCCGPAAFFTLWAERDPLAMAQHVIALYNTAEAPLGPHTVKPDSDLLNGDYNTIFPKPADAPPQADWMFLSTLRGWENDLWDFEGTPDEDFSGITLPFELVRWLKATGVYEKIEKDTSIFGRMPVSHALNLPDVGTHDIILLITVKLLGSQPERSHGLIPDHYIRLRSKIVQNGLIRFDYWSWGANDSQTVDVRTFENDYFGAIICKL